MAYKAKPVIEYISKHADFMQLYRDGFSISDACKKTNYSRQAAYELLKRIEEEMPEYYDDITGDHDISVKIKRQKNKDEKKKQDLNMSMPPVFPADMPILLMLLATSPYPYDNNHYTIKLDGNDIWSGNNEDLLIELKKADDSLLRPIFVSSSGVTINYIRSDRDKQRVYPRDTLEVLLDVVSSGEQDNSTTK